MEAEMTPDYAALAQRLRASAKRDCDDAATYGPLVEANIAVGDAIAADFFADHAAHNANRGLDCSAAASALDRLTGMETALRGLDSATRTFLAGMVKVKKREADKAFYAEDFERCCTALATARRALEDKA